MTLKSNVLTFARSIQPSEGLISAVRVLDDSTEVSAPVEVFEKTVRGQISNAPKKSKDFRFESPNPQAIDYAMMPSGFNRLRIEFSVSFLANTRKPGATDNPAIVANYEKLISTYANRNGFHHLSSRYLWNIGNARWVWRNRHTASEATVTLWLGDLEVNFDPFDLPLDRYPGIEALKKAAINGTADRIEPLIARVARALAGQETAPFMRVRYDAHVAPLSEVFPSQEFANEEPRKATRTVGRVLSSIWVEHSGARVRQATLHSQKIGAAIRFIDEWHGNPEYGAVSVNPFAGVTEMSIALRHPKDTKKSFYTLLDKPDHLFSLAETADLEADQSGDLHFVVANLIRGGVYGAKED